MAHNRGICGSASSAASFPLRVRVTGIVLLLLWPRPDAEGGRRRAPCRTCQTTCATRHGALAARSGGGGISFAVPQTLVTPLPKNLIDAIADAGVDLDDAAREAGID